MQHHAFYWSTEGIMLKSYYHSAYFIETQPKLMPEISFYSQEFVMTVSQWLVLSKGDQMKEGPSILLTSIYATSTNILRFW